MSTSEDEYDVYDLSEFTAEDLASIDAMLQRKEPQATTVASVPLAQGNLGGPAIQIEHEADSNVLTKESGESVGPPPPNLSPFQEFRRNGEFTVSDLVAPTWCEVQYDYGLRQHRNRVLGHRPSSFVSKRGKTIKVEQKTAVKNEKRTKRGQMVHKELEREIRPEEIKVKPNTREELWALRLMNMVGCIQDLMFGGCAREMPVFGSIHGHVVCGIIDEVTKIPIPEPANLKCSSDREQHSTPSDKSTQPALIHDSPLDPGPNPTDPPNAQDKAVMSPTHTLAIADTKTRTRNSLPSLEDSLSSRLQLMMYHHLLADIISSQFDFSAFWAMTHLQPERKFSLGFLHQTQGIIGECGSYVHCLNDLVELWNGHIKMLNISEVHNISTLIYRPQHKKRSSHKPKKKRRSSADVTAFLSKEEQDLSMAIEASLKDAGRSGYERNNQSETDAKVKGKDAASKESDKDSEGCQVHIESEVAQDDRMEEQQLVLTNLHKADIIEINTDSEGSKDGNIGGPSAMSGTTSQSFPSDGHSTIIGKREVEFDPAFLDAHLTDLLQWWHGMRPPRGVSLEQSGRCFSCEYREGCEWREHKANELVKATGYALHAEPTEL